MVGADASSDGETTVTLKQSVHLSDEPGFALALSESLETAAPPLSHYGRAAGTYCRDGPTAPPALSRREHFADIRKRGIEPARALRNHCSYPALDAVTAPETGPTEPINDLFSLSPAHNPSILAYFFYTELRPSRSESSTAPDFQQRTEGAPSDGFPPWLCAAWPPVANTGGSYEYCTSFEQCRSRPLNASAISARASAHVKPRRRSLVALPPVPPRLAKGSASEIHDMVR